jgi:hypothetical protein
MARFEERQEKLPESERSTFGPAPTPPAPPAPEASVVFMDGPPPEGAEAMKGDSAEAFFSEQQIAEYVAREPQG